MRPMLPPRKGAYFDFRKFKQIRSLRGEVCGAFLHPDGQRILAELSKQGKTIILEINPPVDEISVRRRGFYERCGFAENPYPHVHLPYHKGNCGHELVVMYCPGKITQGDYDAFNVYLTREVM